MCKIVFMFLLYLKYIIIHFCFLDILGLVSAVKDVYQQTRAMRTTVWCAVHLVTCETIPKVDVIQENDSTTLSKLNSEEGMDEVS